MRINIEVTPLGIYGATPSDQQALDNLKKGYYALEIKRPRNYEYHKRFFALMNIAYEMQSAYKSLDSFLDAVKIAAGEFEAVQVKIPEFEKEMEGVDYLVLKPKSISFAAMSQPDFEDFYSRVVDSLIKNFCPGNTPEEMDALAMKYITFA